MNLRSTADIYELMGVYLPSAALSAALELGLFWRLADGPQPLAHLSREMGIPLQRCAYWLRLLAALNLLEEREGERFLLSPVARTAIVGARRPDTWKMLAIEARENYAEGVSFTDRLLSSSSAEGEPDHLTGYVRKMADDLDRARLFARLLLELHRPLAEAIAETLDLEGARRLLDVGGGSGVISFALLRKYPQLTAVVADIPNTCVAGREIADTLPEGERISYYPVNFLRDELPGGFDIVLECDVAQFDDSLLAKMVASLNDGGRLIIVDQWFDTGEHETPGRLAYLLRESLKDPGFSLKSPQEVQAGLARAGLEPGPVMELPNKRWKLIEARKRSSEQDDRG